MEGRHKWLLVPATTAVVAALLAAPLALAKGHFSTIIVMSLGTGEVRMVNEPDLQGFFSLSDFSDGTRDPIAPGSTYIESYELTRLAAGQNGGLFAVDRIRYVPPGSKEHGYVLYEGLINGSSEYDGKWFSATSSGDAVMKRVLASPSTPSHSLPLGTAVALSLTALAAGLVLGTITQRRSAAIVLNTDKVPKIRAA